MKAEQTMNAFHRQLNARKKNSVQKPRKNSVRSGIGLRWRHGRNVWARRSVRFSVSDTGDTAKRKKNVIAFKEIISVGHVGSTSFIRVLVVFAARFRRYWVFLLAVSCALRGPLFGERPEKTKRKKNWKSKKNKTKQTKKWTRIDRPVTHRSSFDFTEFLFLIKHHRGRHSV